MLIKATKIVYDTVKKQEQKSNTLDKTKKAEEKCTFKFKYYGNTCESQRCLAYGRSCSGCQKLNHFEQVYRSHNRQVPQEDKRDRAVHDVCQDNEDKEVSMQEFDTVRSRVSVCMA